MKIQVCEFQALPEAAGGCCGMQAVTEEWFSRCAGLGKGTEHNLPTLPLPALGKDIARCLHGHSPLRSQQWECHGARGEKWEEDDSTGEKKKIVQILVIVDNPSSFFL